MGQDGRASPPVSQAASGASRHLRGTELNQGPHKDLGWELPVHGASELDSTGFRPHVGTRVYSSAKWETHIFLRDGCGTSVLTTVTFITRDLAAGHRRSGP